MLFFGVCFFLYFIKLSAGNGFFSLTISPGLIFFCKLFLMG